MIKLTFRKNLYLLTAACAMLGIAFALLVWVLAPVRVVAQGPTEISSDDLIAYWKLDEGSGSTAADSSDNGYDLSLNTGVMTYTSDIPTLSFSNTYALDFTGSGEANSASAKVDSLQELSIALWVKPDTLSGINRFLTLGNEKAVLRSQNSGDLHFYMKIDGSLQYIVTGTVATGGWQHVAGTYDSSVMRLYLDGSEVGTLSYTGVVSAGNGVHLSAGGSESLDGKLDDIRIYNRALSANEIALLASGSEGFACATEYSGDTTTDFVSSDNSALQLAVDNAPAGSTIKAAGACAGVQNINSLTQTVYISKNLTIQGGYTNTNWTVSNPVTNPTTLDALDNGRVAYIPSGVTVTLDSLTLQNGYTSGDGAGIYSSGALTLTNSLLRENWAGSEGGGLYAHQNGVSTFISNTRIISNTSWDGGGGFYANQPITIVNSVVNSNTTTSYGGGGQLEAGAQFFIQNSAFISNTNIKFEGGGLYILSTGTIQNSRVLSNTAFGSEGGGLYLESNAVVALLDSEVAYNQAARGGGIHSYDSRLDVQNSAIHHNTAIEKMNGSGGEGGGLSLQRSVITITRSTIVHNAAELNGGGLYVEEITSVDLLNSTLSHNQAITGGGIYAIASSGTGNRSAAISLTHTTLYSNTATQGGGIYLKDAINGNDDIAQALLQNSLIADNSPTDCATENGWEALDATPGYNLDSDGTCIAGGGTGNLTNSQPKLGPLQNNGGDTETHALLSDSPAIDKIAYSINGCGSTVTTDQRGVIRSNYFACDMGAYEVEDTSSHICFVRNNNTAATYSSSDASAVQYAVDLASAGHYLKVAGTCVGINHQHSLTQTVYISKDITIQGGYTNTNWSLYDPSTYTTTLDAQDSGRVVYIPTGITATLDSLTLQNGYTSEDGAGIYSSGALTLTNSLLRENWAGYEGGGLYAHQNGVSIFISNTRIISNTSWEGGGGFYANQPITIVNSVVNSNTTTSYGGGGQLEAGARFFIQNSDFISNTNAKFEGGGLYILSVGTIQNSRVLSNTAFGSEGGGLYLESDAVVALLDSEVAYNQAARGGGIHSYDSQLDVQNSTIHHNTAITKTNGSAGEGGGLSLQRSVITITRSTLVHNAAESDGGGIYVEQITSVDLRNSTLSHNQATTGGGIYAAAGSGSGNRSAAIRLTHTTLYSNTATQGGGIYLKDAIDGNDDIAQALLQNSLIAGNSPTDCATENGWEALDATPGYNLDSDGACIAGGGMGNLSSSDPKLGPLQNNGGDTDTHALLLGSPAIDAIPIGSCAVSNDQRGIIRPQGDSCDMGAFEFQGFSLIISGGNNQSTLKNTVFATPLQVIFAASDISPTIGAGQAITFSAPGSGASLTTTPLTATTNSSSVASVTVTANSVVGSYVVTATASGIGNHVTFVLTNTVVDLTITKSVSPTTAASGETITYTLAFSNAGTGIATGVVITDSIPVSVTHSSLISSSSGATITSTGGFTYAWSVDNLSPNEWGIITISGILSGNLSIGTTFTNTAEITTTLVDSNTINNEAATGLTIISNTVPVAVSDVYTTFVNAPLNVSAPGVLSNDSDANGHTMTAVLYTGPTTGNLSLNVDGSFVYTPNLDFIGVDTFTYRAVDNIVPGFPNRNGLVGYWPFDEGSGFTAADESGNSYTATLSSGANFSANVPFIDHNAFSLNLDGADDRAQVAGPISLANQSFSVAVWARRASNGTDDFIVSQGSNSQHNGLHIGFRGNNLFTCAFWSNDLSTPSAYTDADWHHWACTYNAATRQRTIYRDGLPVALDIASDHYQGSGDLHFGNRFGNGFFGGQIDEPAIYQRELSADEIANLILGSSSPMTVTLNVLQNADLSLAKTVAISGSRPIRGQAITYTLAFSNVGVLPAGGVIITDQLPISLTNLSYSSNKAVTPTGGFSYTWQVEDLAVGESGLITISGQVSNSSNLRAQKVTNYASISTDSDEGIITNNRASITFTVLNEQPVAATDVYTGYVNTPLTIVAPGVLSNDYDIDIDPLAAVLQTGPTNGALQLNIDGSFVYTPGLNFIGVDTFTYRAYENINPVLVHSDNLAGYWPFNEGSGASVADTSGNGHTGALHNGAGFSSNVPFNHNNPYALNLDGNDDRAQASEINLANQSFSVVAWARRASIGGFDYIVSQGSNDTNKGLHIGFQNDNEFTCAFWGNDLNTGTTYTDTDWHHWVCTYNAATRQRIIYRDGLSVASDTASAHYQGSGPLHFGNRFGSRDFFGGQIDELAIYQRELNADEIFDLIPSASPPTTVTLNILRQNADLSLAKTVAISGSFPVGGQAITYTLAFSNVGVLPAGGVIITDQLPISLTNFSYSSNKAVTPTSSFSYTWQVEDLAVGESGLITISGQLSNNLRAQKVTNYASISTGSDEGIVTNNRASIAFIVLNEQPVAVADVYTGSVNSPLTIVAPGVLSNDYDDLDPLEAMLQTGPISGAIQLNVDGSFVYTPSLNFTGVDTFTYRAVDNINPAFNNILANASGLAGYWPFDEGSGASAADASGNGHTGALYDDAGFSSNVPFNHNNPYALNLDGNNDRVQASEINLANQSFSVAVWARRTSSNSDDFIMSQGSSGSQHHGLHIGFRGNNRFTCDFWNNSLDTPSAYTDADWHHWACTYNAATTQRTIYRDGLPVASDTASAHYQGSGDLHFGSRFGNGLFFGGQIDELAIYQRDLNAAEVFDLMLSASPPTTVTLNVLQNADLSLLKTVAISGTRPVRGQTITYTLAFSNVGILPASGVVITDQLPISLTNFSYSSNKAVTPTGSFSYTWQVEDLAVGESGLITVSGQVSNNLVTPWVTNHASISTGSDEGIVTNNSASVTFMVNLPPVIMETAFSVVENSANNTLVGTVSVLEANNDPLSGYTILSGDPAGVFTLGSSNGQLRVNDNSTLDFETTTQYTLTIRVSDGLLTDTGLITVNVLNATPDLTISKHVTPVRDKAGALITYTLTFINISGDLADGVVITDQLPISLTNISYSSNKAVTPTGSFSYTWQVEDLAIGESGLITISGQLSDNLRTQKVTNQASISTGSDEGIVTNNRASITFTVLNEHPVAATDVYTGYVNTPLTIVAPGVLSNDYDADPLEAVLQTGPTSGSLQLKVDGGFVYTPSLNFIGVDTFTYRAVDNINPVLANNDNLAGYWPFNEGSGSSAADESGHGHTGALYSGAGFSGNAPSSYNNPYALNLDGNNDRVQASSINLANQSFSVAVWARRTSSGSYDIIISQGSNNQHNKLHIGFRDTNLFTCAFGSNDLDTPSTYTDTDWHHWACTYNAATRQRIIYREGLPVASDTASAHYQGSGDLHFGSLFGSGDFFGGQIDELAIYQRELNATEVFDLMLSASPPTTVTLHVLPISDLTLTKNVTPSQVVEGETITYTLTFSNTGSDIATGVVITDFIPISVTYSSLNVSSDVAITQTGGVSYAWNVEDLSVGEWGVITISGVLSDDLPAGAFTNTAQITAAMDGDASNNNASADLVVLGPEIAVIGGGAVILNRDTTPSVADDTDFGNALVAGGTVTRTFTISNSGAGVLKLRGTPNVTLTTGTHFDVNLQPGSSTIGSGDTTTFQITFDPLAVGSHQDTVNIQSNDAGENPYTFVLSGTGTAADLSLAKTVDPGAALPGDIVTYTLTFSNAGNSKATGVIITDIVPISLTNTSAISSGLAITQTNAGVYTYTWQVQDMASGETGIITISGVLRQGLPAGPFGNTATITTTDSDDNPANNESSAVVTVLNAAPLADDDSFSVVEDSADNVLNVLDGDSDANNDTLTVDALGEPDQNGTLINAGTHVTYTPALNFDGTETFTYTVGDGNGGLDTATVLVTVTATNDAPVAVDDGYVTGYETPLIVLAATGVLSNDLDIEGDLLTATVDTGPVHGDLALNPNGSFIYTPTTGFSGSDTFSYHASDGADDSNAATVTIDVGTVPTYTLIVSVVGSGEVTPDPAGTVLLPTGWLYEQGDVVTLTATPEADSEFIGWSGALNGASSPVTLTMNGDKAVTATFDLLPVVPTTYALTLAADGTGSGKVTPTVGAHVYDEGEVVTLTATPDADSEFIGWSGALSGASSPVTLTMNGDQVITATFDLLPVVPTYTLTIAADGTGSGTVTPTVGAHVYDEGEVVTMTATPDAVSEFIEWSGARVGMTRSITLTMDADQAITATFDLLPNVPTYTLTVLISPTMGGSVTPSGGVYAENTVVTLTAVPESGYEFVAWSGDLVNALDQVTVTITQDMTVTANFDQTEFTIYLPLVLR